MKCKTPFRLNDKQSWPLANFLVAVIFSLKDDVDKIQLQYSDLQKTWNHTTDWKLLEGNNGFWVKRETELGLSLLTLIWRVTPKCT